MKKVKILSIIVLLLFLTGCDATYELVIKDDKVIEKLSLVEDKSLVESFTNSQKYVNENLKALSKEDKYKKYKVETYIDDTINGITTKEYNSFDLFNKQSELIHEMFKNVEYNKTLKTISITMTPVDNFDYLDDNSLYMPFLNSIKIKIKIDGELVSGNYDEIDDEYYVWNINKMPLKKIEISYKNEYNPIKKITRVEWIFIILTSLVLLFILETYVKYKIKTRY